MDDRAFDSLVRSLASGANRRQIVKGLFGLGGATLAGATVIDAGAARRPTPTPKPRTCPGVQLPCGSDCCCPDGFDTCGSDCCPSGVAQCCDNACCYGECYGEELCCPANRQFCAATGECCPQGWTCCPDVGCLAPGQCCTAADCAAELCTQAECGADHVCDVIPDCTNHAPEQSCCSEAQVCLDDGSCCTPVCENCNGGDGCGGTCACLDGQVCLDDGSCCTPTCDSCSGDDGCGGSCACPDGYGCGDDGACHVCTVCSPQFERCGGTPSCYTYCTPDGVMCLYAGSQANPCTNHDDCQNGAYCMRNCVGTFCFPPCGSIA